LSIDEQYVMVAPEEDEEQDFVLHTSTNFFMENGSGKKSYNSETRGDDATGVPESNEMGQ
jgi:hypothetical protein